VSHPDFTAIGSTQPDWVMAGIPAPNGAGVWLLASKELTYAELTAQFDRAPDMYWDDPRDVIPGPVVGQRIALTVTMRTFVIIEAPDYPAAFTALFEHLQPGPGPARPGIEQGRPAIPPQRPEIGPGR
jgi:hypothetical protein